MHAKIVGIVNIVGIAEGWIGDWERTTFHFELITHTSSSLQQYSCDPVVLSPCKMLLIADFHSFN